MSLINPPKVGTPGLFHILLSTTCLLSSVLGSLNSHPHYPSSRDLLFGDTMGPGSIFSKEDLGHRVFLVPLEVSTDKTPLGVSRVWKCQVTKMGSFCNRHDLSLLWGSFKKWGRKPPCPVFPLCTRPGGSPLPSAASCYWPLRVSPKPWAQREGMDQHRPMTEL